MTLDPQVQVESAKVCSRLSIIEARIWESIPQIYVLYQCVRIMFYYMHTYLYTYDYIYIYAYVCSYSCKHIFIHIHIHMHVHVHTHIYIYIYHILAYTFMHIILISHLPRLDQWIAACANGFQHCFALTGSTPKGQNYAKLKVAYRVDVRGSCLIIMENHHFW